MSTGNVNRPTKNERRQQAREQAKVARETQQKKERRNRLALQGGIVAGIIAIAVIVTLVIVQSVKPEGPGPKNMASGGVVFDQGFEVATTPALKAGEEPTPTKVNRDELPLDIVIYVDYMCPICGEFEQANQALLDELVESGDATIELHAITALNEYSMGTRYSSRAANALGCMVNYDPKNAWKFHSALLSAAVQPEEGTEGLSNDQLIAQAKSAGADVDADIADCIETETFMSFMDAQSARALAGPVPNLAEGTDLPNVQGTPTVLVNGVQYVATEAQPWSDPTAFRDFVYNILNEYNAS